MSDKSTSSSGGVSVVGLLGVAFVVLKLTHVIDWPWVWVLAPFWGGFVFLILFLLIYLSVLIFGSKRGRW